MEVQKAQKAQIEAQRSLTWALTSGPVNPSPSAGQDADPALFPYCVVVCPVIVRWRAELRAMFRLPVKATYPRSFLPDVPGTGGPTSQGSNISSSSSLPTAAPNSSTRGTTRMSDLQEVDGDPAAAIDNAADNDDDDDSDECSDDDGPPDLLSSILDSILDVRPDIELAVGAWTAITGYTTTYGSLPVAEDCVKVIEPAINKDGEPVAHLAHIEPVPAHHVQSPQDLIRVPPLEMPSSHSTDLSNEISDISPRPIVYDSFIDIYRAKWKNHGNEQDVCNAAHSQLANYSTIHRSY
ncbi:hypothetical protein EXIGLDRAFT_382599 [Exidia glandulosa HHB12029]|uniref:Uncharacterized protein n=1 Tax=Exidia glandulosa HHB12029 TaxID=1314781 RepID=A0A165BYK9_EXIGL|nr:hypothetical protein EXIGLDRAFT_382599 [Exidia glandulosa HHB12029]